MTERAKGQITVFSALTIMLVLSLVCTCIKSAGVSAVRAQFEAAAALSMESVFAGYSNPLLEEFDIFARKDTDNFSGLLTHYMKENSSDGAQLMSCEMSEKILMTDCKGECVVSEIAAYMKAGGFISSYESSEDLKKQKEQSEALKEITEEITDCENAICEMDTCILGIIQETEGLSVDNTGIVIFHEEPVSTGKYFVKAVIPKKISMDVIGIKDGTVYMCAQKNDKYINVCESIDNMLADVSEYESAADSGDDDSDADMEDYSEAYKNEYDLLDKALSESLSATERALKNVNDYNRKKGESDRKVSECMEKLNQKRDMLGGELYTSLYEEIEKLQKDGGSSLCDIDEVSLALEEKEMQLTDCMEALQNIDSEISRDNISELYGKLDMLYDSFLKFSNDDLVFDYSGINFSQKTEGLKKIKEIYKTISEGITELVVDADKISDKTISYKNLAGNYMKDNTLSESSSSAFTEAEKELLYNEYLFKKFPSYTDYISKDGSFEKDSEKQLDYMIEYILYGKSSDKENLSLCVSELALLREGINLAYLLTDSEKKQEAYVLALSLAGYTGNMALVQAAKYLILAAWAYGESVVELRQLYMGKKAEPVKHRESWHLSLENLLKLEFDDDTSGDKGMDYEEYLRMLLLMEDSVKKNYRTMEAMELRMIELGNPSFRMKDYIYGAEADIVYRITLTGQYVQKHVSYNYG
jgi:hypothetical protein